MKILIISFFFPPCSTGAATVMRNLFKYIPGGVLNVITAGDDLAVYFGISDENCRLNCRTVQLKAGSNRLFGHLRFLLLAIWEGLMSIFKTEYDCILAVYPIFSDLLAGYILHILTQKPFFIYMHDLFIETRRGAVTYRLLAFLERKVFSAASTIFVMNAKYTDHYRKKGTLLPPSVDPLEVQLSLSPENPIDENRELTFVFTGSVYEAQEDAILTFLQACRKTKHVRVVFATPAKETYLSDRLRTLLREVNLGFLPRKQCWRLQNSADVLFLPLSFSSSYPEEIKCAFPCKLLEYLAAGKPILALVPKDSFVEAFVREHHVGIVVTELSTERIADAIEELKDSQKRKMYAANSLKAVRFFDGKKCSKDFLSILESLLKEND
jgi:glycosyltransferase involved in cell wall biosynthesis